jgi:hypothetical protein
MRGVEAMGTGAYHDTLVSHLHSRKKMQHTPVSSGIYYHNFCIDSIGSFSEDRLGGHFTICVAVPKIA